MKIIAGLLALFILLGMACADIETYSPYESDTGRYIMPSEYLGGPWYHDYKGPTFGDSKNASITWNKATSSLDITANKACLGGTVIPLTIPVCIAGLSSSSADTDIYIPPGSWQVVSVKESHVVAGTDSGSVTLVLKKCTGTQTPSAGAAVMTNTFNLKGAAETIQTGTLATGSGICKVNSTERLALAFSGTKTTYSGGCVTIGLQAI